MTGAETRLTIGLSTLYDRLRLLTLDRLPVVQGAEYLIVVQFDPEIVDEAFVQQVCRERFLRDDVRVETLSGYGVARSRNAVIDHARTEFLWFADDDLILYPEVIARIPSLFDARPGMAVLCGKSANAAGEDRKAYPSSETRLTRFNSARYATFEIATALPLIKGKNIRFDTGFGAGTKNYLGDEYIFIVDSLAAGLCCSFVLANFCKHPSISSGLVALPEKHRAQRVLFKRVFGSSAMIFYFAFALKQTFRSLFRRFHEKKGNLTGSEKQP